MLLSINYLHLFPTNFGQSACNSVKVQPISTLRLPNHARPAAEPAEPPKLPALFPKCMHCRLNWPEKGVFILTTSKICTVAILVEVMMTKNIDEVMMILDCHCHRSICERERVVANTALQSSSSLPPLSRAVSSIINR